MSGLWAILSRELRAYFVSPMAYVILTFFLIGNGVVFFLITAYLNDPRAGISTITPLQVFFGSIFYWLVLICVVPVLTMRLISEELRSGTIETLMTSPVSEGQVVIAKYLASLVFYGFLWLPTVAYALIVEHYGDIDWGPVAAGYLGVFGMGAMFLAIGVFGSTFTKNQIVAATVTFGILVVFFCAGFLDNLVTGETSQKVLEYVNLLKHMDEFGKGVVDTRHLVYYLTTSVLFLFLASRALEARKWR